MAAAVACKKPGNIEGVSIRRGKRDVKPVVVGPATSITNGCQTVALVEKFAVRAAGLNSSPGSNRAYDKRMVVSLWAVNTPQSVHGRLWKVPLRSRAHRALNGLCKAFAERVARENVTRAQLCLTGRHNRLNIKKSLCIYV